MPWRFLWLSLQKALSFCTYFFISQGIQEGTFGNRLQEKRANDFSAGESLSFEIHLIGNSFNMKIDFFLLLWKHGGAAQVKASSSQILGQPRPYSDLRNVLSFQNCRSSEFHMLGPMIHPTVRWQISRHLQQLLENYHCILLCGSSCSALAR